MLRDGLLKDDAESVGASTLTVYLFMKPVELFCQNVFRSYKALQVLQDSRYECVSQAY